MRAGTPILERGDLTTVFEHSFQCFSYKSFVKLSRKGGGRGGGGCSPSVPPLNSCMVMYNRVKCGTLTSKT